MTASFGERETLLKFQNQNQNQKHLDINENVTINIIPKSEPNVSGHLESLKSLEAKYGSDLKNGLTRSAVHSRQAKGGRNVMNLPSNQIIFIFRGWLPADLALGLSKFIEQFLEPLIGLLLVSAAVSLFLGQVENALSIGVAVLIVGTVGFIQEYRTEKSLEALKKLAPPRCKVVRDGGRVWDVLAEDLVVGDVVELSMGGRVPADVILITANDFQIDESILTGEERPVKKSTSEYALMGTLIRQGRARGLVTQIGLKTEFGRIAALMNETEERRSPLQLRLDQLGNQLTIYSVIVIVIISLIGYFLQKRRFVEIFTVAVSLAVAAIPEGLPIVATITLALGVLRLANKGVVVKKLPAVEALGSMTVLCADKTGTLTMNEMSVDSVYSTDTKKMIFPTNSAAFDWWKECKSFAQIAWFCNDAVEASNSNESKWHGNSTDVAFKRLLHLRPLEPVQQISISRSIPFNSETKLMAVFDELHARWMIKGAADILITRGPQAPELEVALEEMNVKGLRIIAFGYSETDDFSRIEVKALAGLVDPCRPGINHLIESVQKAKIQPIMITGDARESAVAVAQRIGWLKTSSSTSSSGVVVSGSEMMKKFATCPGSQIESFLNGLAIVYRATPEQKLHLVRQLQEMKHVVAMTGDGVNDAPALKLADIGIAMSGTHASDVAREAANIILSDDDLSRIIEGVAEGRGIFRNIRHFVRFQLGVSMAALGLMSMTTLTGLPAPLTALQILLINIIMDGPPAQSLGVEPSTPAATQSLLSREPLSADAKILSGPIIMQTALMASVIIALTLLGYPISKQVGSQGLLTYATFVSCTIAYALTCRSSTRSVIFSLPNGGPLSNKVLNWSLALTAALLLITCHVPFFLAPGIKKMPLSAWLLPLLSVAVILISDEMIKVAGKMKGVLVEKRRVGGYDALIKNSYEII